MCALCWPGPGPIQAAMAAGTAAACVAAAAAVHGTCFASAAYGGAKLKVLRMRCGQTANLACQRDAKCTFLTSQYKDATAVSFA